MPEHWRIDAPFSAVLFNARMQNKLEQSTVDTRNESQNKIFDQLLNNEMYTVIAQLPKATQCSNKFSSAMAGATRSEAQLRDAPVVAHLEFNRIRTRSRDALPEFRFSVEHKCLLACWTCLPCNRFALQQRWQYTLYKRFPPPCARAFSSWRACSIFRFFASC